MSNSKFRQKESKVSIEINDMNTISDFLDKEEQLNQTRLEPQYEQVEETYESGTMKITPELAKKAVLAIETRIESTKTYTDNRIKVVSDAYKMKEQSDLSTGAVNQMYYAMVRDFIEDWVDDLYIMFSNLPDSIEIKSDEINMNEYITKKLEDFGLDQSGDKMGAMLRQISMKVFGKQKSYRRKSMYSFKKTDCIKAFIKKTLRNSGYLKEIEEYLDHGVTSGLFCSKETYGNVKTNTVILREESEGSKEGEQYIGLGNIKSIINNEDNFIFKAVDTRKLIFPKNKISWVIEKIDTTFHNLLEQALDVNGKPRKESPYDYTVLKKIKEYVKDNKNLDLFKNKDEDFYDSTYVSDYEGQNIFEVDGNIQIFEGHNIPLLIGNRITKCIISTVKIGERHIPIRIQPTWFIGGIPYRMKNFAKKDNDVAGYGLPAILKLLQDKINDIFNFSTDILEFAIYGITIGDKDKLANPNRAKALSPRDFIQVKNMEGQPVKEAFDWIRPPVDLLPSAQNLIEFIQAIASKISRKGPGGEKVAPNPSATEFDSMMREMMKSVNRVAIRINEGMTEMIKTAYIYTVMNRNSYTNLNITGTQINNKQAGKQIKQTLRLTARELYMEGIEFEVTALDFDVNKRAVEKQQAMQAVDLMYKIGVDETVQETDPTTGQQIQTKKPKVFYDNAGNELVIDEYNLVQDAMKKLGYDASRVFKLKEDYMSERQQKTLSTEQTLGAENKALGKTAPNTPDLNKSPKESNILGGAMQV